jgi:hypothetical protein
MEAEACAAGILQRGVVKDWGALEKLWRLCLEQLQVAGASDSVSVLC